MKKNQMIQEYMLTIWRRVADSTIALRGAFPAIPNSFSVDSKAISKRMRMLIFPRVVVKPASIRPPKIRIISLGKVQLCWSILIVHLLLANARENGYELTNSDSFLTFFSSTHRNTWTQLFLAVFWEPRPQGLSLLGNTSAISNYVNE